MKLGGGRRKGNSFELTVAKLIVDNFKDYGIEQLDCYRTPQSGGHRFAKQEDPGDLVISKKLRTLFPFKVECKFYKHIELFPLWLPVSEHKKAWHFKDWLSQACKAPGDAHPLLVFKQNNGPILCALPTVLPVVTMIENRMIFQYEFEEWYVVLFSELLRVLVERRKEIESIA